MFLYVVVSSVYIINHSLHGKLNVRRLGIATSQQPLFHTSESDLRSYEAT